MAIQVIKATRTQATPKGGERKALRVAAYCRVSTDSAEQETSYEAQKRHYQTLIEGRPEWTLAGIFADEGISGTQAKKRPEFLRLIEECKAGRVDLVVTKSISRFSRNTVDCLNYIRELKSLGIAVLFEKENINTLDAKGEVLITIMASIAQQESLSISQNVRIGIQYRMQQGHGRLNTSVFLGLRNAGAPGEYEIVPEEAEVARRIFREYLEGYSPAAIAERLEAEGVLTGAGRPHWYPSTVVRILENEKYCGDLVLQKYYTEDVLTHKVVKNDGLFPQYLVDDHHPPIVPREVFQQVQGEIARRSPMRGGGARDCALSGKLVCGKCGRTLKRFEGSSPDWRCRKRAGKMTDAYKASSSCNTRFVPESEAKAAVLEALSRLPGLRDSLIREQATIRAGEIRRIDRLIEMATAREREAREKGEAEAESLHQMRENLKKERAEHAHREMEVRLLLELIDPMPPAGEWGAECADYEEFFIRTRREKPVDFEEAMRHVERIIVQEKGLEVVFKAGISIRV